MKIRTSVWATSLLIASATLCAVQIQSRSVRAQADQDDREIKGRIAFEEEGKKFATAFFLDRANNYKAKSSNGSHRQGRDLQEVPEPLRKEVAQAIRQYQQIVYPALKKYTGEHSGELPVASFNVPELKPLLEDREYKGTGPKVPGRGGWSFGPFTRMDGTAVARDIYAKNAPDAPHDPWAKFWRFENTPSLDKAFRVTGWDDGRVTIDFVNDCFHGRSSDFWNKTPFSFMSVPGEAGVLPEAVPSLDEWQKRQRARSEKSSAEGDKAIEQHQKENAVTTEQPLSNTAKQ